MDSATDKIEVFLTLVYSSRIEDYGFTLDESKHPLTVSYVQKSSPAAIGGLQQGDKVLLVNGHDVSSMEGNRIQSIISYSQSSPVTMKVLRMAAGKVSSPNIVVKESVESDSGSFKRTLDGAVQTALDAVTMLSEDMSFQYEEDKTMTNDYLEPDDDLQQQEYRDSSPQEIMSEILKAQHGIQDILSNVKQNKVTDHKKQSKLVSSEGSIMLERSDACPPHTDTPPPVPPYNPSGPEYFLLSNKPEYQIEIKKHRHCYEEVELTENQKVQSSVVDDDKIDEPMQPSLMKKQMRPSNNGSLMELMKGSKGIPASVHAWKKEHVLLWLQKLDLTLFNRCKDMFDHHDVTGHTLLHLNDLKLESMGINNDEDRTQLGTSVAKLRLSHEFGELKELSDKVSWL